MMEQIYEMTIGNAAFWFSGIKQTVWLVSLSLMLGLIIAIPCGILLAAKVRFIWKFPAWLFSYVFRGTPMLVQLYVFYYGVGLLLTRVDGIQESAYWHILKEAYPWVILALTLNTAAYTMEIVKAAILSTPKGEIEAAISVGMSKFQITRRVVLPGAIRRALPVYGNEIIFMIHGSAIASLATLMDITGVARKIYTSFYEPFIPFITAGIIYLIITGIVAFTFKHIEKRLNRHL